MATVQFIVQAINRATQAFNDIAVSAAKMGKAVDGATAKVKDLQNAAAAAAAVTARLTGRLRDAATSAAQLNTAMSRAAASARDMRTATATAATAVNRLTGAVRDARTQMTGLATSAAAAVNRIRDLSTASLATTAALNRATAAVRDLRTAAAGAAVALAAVTAATAATGTAAAAAGTRWLGWFGILGRGVPLFGGLLAPLIRTVSGWHLLADAIAEVIAVWAPAIVAAGAFGVAASDAVNNVIRHMTNLHTVMDATGQAIPPMTNALEKMHQAVQPAVYQIFGEALNAINSKAGQFNTLVTGTTGVVQQLAARMAAAVQNGSAMNIFMKNAVQDLSQLGNAFGNVFGAIGNLIRVVPGYANQLLGLGVALTALIEHATAALAPIIQLGLALHGLILYVGLAVTGVMRLGPVIAGWAAGFAGAAMRMAGFIRTVYELIAAEGLLDTLSLINPLGWVAIAAGLAAGLTALVFWLGQSKNATQQWADSMQSALKNVTSLSQGTTLLFSDLQQADAKLNTATAGLAKSTAGLTSQQKAMANSLGYTAEGFAASHPLITQQTRDVNQLTGVQKQLLTQWDTYQTRLGLLARQYGGVTNAQGLLTASGVTMTQMINGSGAAWEQIQVQVAGTYAGYKAMGVQQGALGNDMQVLDKQAGDQYAAIQKLNQAWDTQTTAVTSTQNSFDTFAQGLSVLSNDAGRFTLRLGKLSESGTQARAAIDSLSASGINLNQAFTQQIGNAQTLMDTWRTAGISQDLFNKGVRDAIAPLTRYANGSQEATTQLIDLAQQAGYQGPASMQALSKWLGNTSGATKNLKDITDQATLQEALLTSAMQAQGQMLAGKLIGDINEAILAYNGVEKAATAYGKAIAQTGAQSDATAAARKTLITDLIASGRAAGDSNTQIAAMIATVLKIPAKVAMEIVMTGDGSFSIRQAIGPGRTVNTVTGNLQAIGGHTAAAGLYVRGGTPGKDSVLISAMPGEVVVPVSQVRAGAVDHLRGKIPGFAGGGLVQAGNTSVLSGQFAASAYASFKDQVTQAMLAAMKSAITQAADSAATAALNAARSAVAASGAGASSGGPRPGGMAAGGIVTRLYDQGGVLKPGITQAVNNTGQDELVLPSSSVQTFTLTIRTIRTPLTQVSTAVNTLTKAATTQTGVLGQVAAALNALIGTAKATSGAHKSSTSQLSRDLAESKKEAGKLRTQIKEVVAALKRTPEKTVTGNTNTLYTALQARFKFLERELQANIRGEISLIKQGATVAKHPKTTAGAAVTYTNDVVDKKAEAELASILSELRAMNAAEVKALQAILGELRAQDKTLSTIAGEVSPAAQAKALAAALNSASGKASSTGSHSTRRG